MTNLKKDFFKFAVPSVVGMLVSALYIVVDGIFVGRGVGASALAAVNITLPYISLLTAFSMMIAMGGCTLMSIKFGEGNVDGGRKIFLQSMFLVLLFSIVLSLLGISYSEELVYILGASTELAPLASEYMANYLLFGIFFSISLSLSAFVRNDNNPKLAMVALIIGALSNIVLDYVFIFEFNMGIKGAAIASGLGQIFSVLVLLLHFIFKKGSLKIGIPHVDFEEWIQILKTGTPELIVQLSSPINIFIYNIIIMNRIGELGVSAFGIIGYLITILLGVFIGVGQGAQPLISFYHGKQENDKVMYIFKLALKTNFITSLIVYLTLFIFGEGIVSVFTTDAELINFTSSAIKIYTLSFVIASINVLCITFLLATNNTKKSNIISFNRGILFNIVTVLILPLVLGDTGIWAAIILCEVLTIILISYSSKDLISKEMLNPIYLIKSR